MCDDCDKRYSENKQLGPKFLVCNCDPKHPRELEIEMAKSEIEQNKIIVGDNEGGREVINYDPFKTKSEQYKDNRRRKKV
jgi:hypothetical protein